MSELYLITGFLGAGKTTFLKNLIREFPGSRIRLIVNEFGKESVDGTLLANIGAALREISGGSVFCACRMDQFEKALRESAAEDPDVILVEASGLSDPTGVRRLFSDTGRFPHIQYRGAVCLVDAVRFPRVYATARACVRQLAASDAALVNKTDLAGEAALSETLALIQGQRPDMLVEETSFGRIPRDFLKRLDAARREDREELLLTEDLTVRRVTLRLSDSISAGELEKFIQMFAEQTFRVKGFAATRDRGTVLVDCTGTAVSVAPYPGEVPPERLGVLTVLSGAKMPVRSAVTAACGWYEQYVLSAEF